MKSIKTISLFLFGLSLFFVAGCADDTTTDTTGAPSKVEYTYSGERSGAFKVEGAYPSQKDGSGATSTLSADRKRVTISAINWTKSGTEANFIDLTLTSSTAIVDNQVFTPTNSNSNVIAVSGYGINHSSFNASDAFAAVSGKVTLTTVKDNQIKGTFDFITANGNAKVITITAGKLDVKY